MAILREVLGTCELKGALSLLPRGGISYCIVEGMTRPTDSHK
jgi:hypothetical protein